MNPSLVLDELGLLRDMLHNPIYSRYMDVFEQDTARKKNGVVHMVGGEVSGALFCKRETDRLAMAEAYFVSAEMMPLVRWAAAGLNETDRFHRDLWPSDYGFLYFEDAYVTTEAWGKNTATKVLTWGRSEAIEPVREATEQPSERRTLRGMVLASYADINDPRDEITRLLREEGELPPGLGRLHLWNTHFISDEERVGPELVVPPRTMAEFAIGEQQLADTMPNSDRFLLALLMLLNQTVTSVEEHQPERHFARRFRRMGLPKRVTVIRLRRIQSANRLEGETAVEWAHRWLVKGHWAWRHCSEEHPGAQPYEKGWRVRLWIAPYVKGPDGKPLKQSEKVYSLVR